MLRHLHQAGTAVLSTQVLGELFTATALTRKIAQPFQPEVARERVERYLAGWFVLPVTRAVVQEAVRGAVEHCLRGGLTGARG